MYNKIAFGEINICKNINGTKSNILPEIFYKLKNVLSVLCALYIRNNMGENFRLIYERHYFKYISLNKTIKIIYIYTNIYAYIFRKQFFSDFSFNEHKQKLFE